MNSCAFDTQDLENQLQRPHGSRRCRAHHDAWRIGPTTFLRAHRLRAERNAVAANPRLQSFHFGDNDLQAEGLLIVTTALVAGTDGTPGQPPHLTSL